MIMGPTLYFLVSFLQAQRQPHEGLHEYQGPYPYDARGEGSSPHSRTPNAFRVVTCGRDSQRLEGPSDL